MKQKKTGKYFPMNATGHMTDKLTLIFSKIFAHWEMTGHGSRVNIVKRGKQKVYFNP